MSARWRWRAQRQHKRAKGVENMAVRTNEKNNTTNRRITYGNGR